MAKNDYAMANEVRRWKDRLSNLENIPVDPNHEYKDQNDIYERMTVYVKGWVEGMFMKYTDATGALKSAHDKGENKDAEEWIESVGNCMTDLKANWWNVALKGQKEGDEPLPSFDGSAIKNEGEQKTARKDSQDAVVDQFFPAYRALEESFKKRWWFEWIFNHKQYTAERDALKVMTNLITSMAGFNKEQFKEAYRRHKLFASEEAVAKAKVAEYDLQKAKEAEYLAKYAEDPNYKEEIIQAPPKPVEDVVYQDVENTLAVFTERDQDEKGFFQVICRDLIKAVEENCILNESALIKSVPHHIYQPLRDIAQKLCEDYDKAKQDGTLDEKVKELIENAGKSMFEKAFKALGATYPKSLDQQNTAMSGKPIFNMNSLKSHIVAAQKLTDIMLKGLTPVGMNAHKHEQFAKGIYLWEKTDQVREFLKETLKDQYTDKKIDWELKAAKNEIGVLHHNAKREVSQVYEIGYRPEVADLKKLSDEGRKIRNLYKMVTPAGKKMQRVISDPSIVAVITANYNKWKAVDEWRNKNVAFNLEKTEGEWAKIDNQLAQIHTNYVPNDVENQMEELLTQKLEAQKIKNAVNDKKVQTAPPVPAPVNTGDRQIKK